jgi:glycosyltransferase involved in cell wall biosynthesis
VLYGSIIARHLATTAVVNSITGLGYVFSSPNIDARALKTLLVPVMRHGCNRPNVTMLFENQDDLALYCAFGIATRERSRVVPSSGIDPTLFELRRHASGPVTVMLLGRMLWDKGVGEFVAAARQIRAQRPQTRFVMVGGTDPNPESIPQRTLSEWHEEGIVEYWGWRSDIPGTLRQADILCLPSYREGLPRSLLEGAAAGLPLVTTDVPGCRDAVRPGVTGTIVPVKDVDALAAAILALVDDPERRRTMGGAARVDAVERFSVDSVIERTCAVYEDALATSASP